MPHSRKIIKYPLTAYALVKNRMLTGLCIKNGKMYVGPWTAYLILTNRCNCHCLQCPSSVADYARNEDDAKNLTLTEYETLIDQLFASGCRRIGITGGEPLVMKDKVRKILGKINERGYSQIVTNGSLLDSDFLGYYNKIGGGHITISVDGLGEAHDRIRGMTGLFDKIEALFDLWDSRAYRNILLKTTFTLFNENVEQLVPFANYCIKRKIPFFIGPYENYQRRKTLVDNRLDPLWIQEDKAASFLSAMAELRELKRKYPHLIINGISHLSAMEDYFLDPEASSRLPKKCYFGYRSVHIHPTGEVATCMGSLESVKDRDFFSIWDSEKFHEYRKRQLSCTKNCLLGCVIDHSLKDLIKVVAYQYLKK